MNSLSAIHCTELSKQYKEVLALNNLNLQVPAGSIFGFLGTNGAGKTTTIKLICGLSHPTSGKITIHGMDINQDEMAVKNRIGYLPQSPRFYGWMTPIEMLDYIGQLHQYSPEKRKQRIDEVLRIVNITNAAKRRISGFSGGMLQRLGIAQAIFHQPSILLLDEPTSSLDPAGRYEVLELIQQLKAHMTIFFSSHILDDVQRICDQIAILHEGKLVLQADIDTLLRKTVSNTFRLEVSESDQLILSEFEQIIQSKPWCISSDLQHTALTVIVENPQEVKENLMYLCSQNNVAPEKLEWQHPTLEDIFLKVSNNHE
ncbi:MAG: ABC transporter ATP-binding protein [Anaerolineaceae bacterium]|nr:ABC transporter ATP-binding protein [Anaerolineaceae bacterium]